MPGLFLFEVISASCRIDFSSCTVRAKFFVVLFFFKDICSLLLHGILLSKIQFVSLPGAIAVILSK